MFQTIPAFDGISKRDYSTRLPKTVETGQRFDALAKSLEAKGCVPIEESVQTSNQAIMAKVLSSILNTNTHKTRFAHTTALV